MKVEYLYSYSGRPYSQYVEGDDWDTLESWLVYFRRNNRIVKSITDNRGRTIQIKQEN